MYGREDGYLGRSFADPSYAEAPKSTTVASSFEPGTFKLTDPAVVRAQPDMNSLKLATLKAGAEVHVVEMDSSGLWYQIISVMGGRPPGWIPAAATRRLESRMVALPNSVSAPSERESHARPQNSSANDSRTYATKEEPPKVNKSRALVGTGVFINTDGHLVTNSHVVDGCQSMNIALGEARMKATLVSIDKTNDLALLKADQPVTSVASFRAGPVKAGENVVAIGFPYRGLLAEDASITNGIISTLAGIANDTRVFQITAPVQPGNSGGPVVDEYGTVVGIVESKLNAILVAQVTGDIPQNINFAIKASTVETFVDYKGVGYQTAPPGPKLPFSQIGEAAKRYTAAIECTK
jgi:S1-C subfamily serine protease